MIRNKKISEDLHPASKTIEPNPEALIIPNLPLDVNNGGKLVKYPTIFDEIPEDVSNLKDYLEQWESES
jgi:hypothetical protein